jgi:gamma-glutamyl-gamma-aminobutyrate hydrolase PuuD
MPEINNDDNPNDPKLDNIWENFIFNPVNVPIPVAARGRQINKVFGDYINILPQKAAQKVIKVKKQEQEKFKIFWGGADIDPSLYNRERSLACGRSNKDQDIQELELVHQYINKGIPIIGICRGAQLLNVANGGILIQHIEGHTKLHDLTIEEPGLESRVFRDVSSTHHQMMIPSQDAIILGRDYRRTDGMHWDNTQELYAYNHVNEVIYYPKTKCLCIQPHPEWMNQDHPFIAWINDFIKRTWNLDPIDFKQEEVRF